MLSNAGCRFLACIHRTADWRRAFAWTLLAIPIVADCNPVWVADHHMHLASPELCSITKDCLASNSPPAVVAADAVLALDTAGVAKGVVLSCGYLYGLASLHLPADDVAQKTRRENQFTADQVAQYPDRLVGFLSVDPLQPSAIDELQYWRGSRQLIGLKLHFAAAGVDMKNSTHRAEITKVLAAAAAEHLPIVIHFGNGSYGEAETESFIQELLPAAGRSWVQIAHLGGGASIDGADARPGHPNLRVLKTFADHIERGDPITRRVLFDLSVVPLPNDGGAAEVAYAVQQMRRIGLNRFVFGSDFNVLSPAEEVRRLKQLKLTPREWRVLQGNCAPWACSRNSGF